jgi:hypothetical protein
MVRKEQEKERVRYADARTATLYGALEQLPAETSRGAKFQDTRESLMDLSMRWYLLTRSDQHCQRFEEMVHHLVRKDGETVSWWEDLPGDPRARYAAAEALFEARAAELGVTGEETLFGTRKGEAMHSAGMQLGRPSGLVLARNMKPEAFSDSLVYSMERCLPLETRAAKWDELRELAEGWGFLDDPLYKMWDGGEVTVTPRDSMDLYAAMARAKARGVDAEVSRMTEAVLARHPEGDGGRRRILSRISEVVQAGESYEGRLAGRMGWSAEALAGAARAVGDGDASLVRLDVPMCASMTERRKDRVDKELERYAEKLAEEQERFRLDAGVSLGGFLAPMILAGCFEGEQPVLKTDEAYPAIREALDRRHPATLDDEGCSESIATLAEAVNDEAEEKLLALAEDMRGYTIEGMLHQVYSLTWRRCLIGVRPRH